MTPPEVVIIAGPNGSGKSTLTQALSELGVALPPAYINPDDILREMRREMPQADQKELERAAFLKGRELRQTYREQGISFAFETVFSHPSGLLDIQKARESGFIITLVVVTTSDPAINVGRVAQRVLSGGHNVNTTKILERHRRFMRLLPRIVEEADRAFVFDADDVARLCYTSAPITSSFGTVASNIPEYLQHDLTDLLSERKAERDQIEAIYGNALELPNKESGSYSGVIRVSQSHHSLHECEPNRFIRHDALLLNRTVQLSETVRIVYRQGEGLVTEVNELQTQN